MSHKLAFLTVAVLHEPVGSPRVRGFVDRLPAVYAAADASAGFQARSMRDVATWKHSWGKVVLPRCYPKFESTDQVAMTLSLWDDLESIAAFAYKDAHGEALAYRKDWFQSLGLPTYVAWWVPPIIRWIGKKARSGSITYTRTARRRSPSTSSIHLTSLGMLVRSITWRCKPREKQTRQDAVRLGRVPRRQRSRTDRSSSNVYCERNAETYSNPTLSLRTTMPTS